MQFNYKAVDKNGQMKIGVQEAKDKSVVIASLKSQGLIPVSVTDSTLNSVEKILPKAKPKAKDLSMFCEQLCSLLRAGVSIVDAMRLLQEQTKKKSLQEAIQTNIVSVNNGETLNQAMAKSQNVFDETLINLVKAGEESGSLDMSLDRMANQYKKDAEVAAAVKKALVYPIVVLIVAVIVIVIMLMYVVPSFMEMFMDIGIEMPKITLMVVSMSEWLMAKWYIALGILVLIIVSISIFLKTDVGKQCVSWLAIKLPVISNFIIKTNASKIARTLSTLLTAGMPIIDALAILEGTLTNYYYKEAIHAIREDVLAGQPMSRKFRERIDIFPNMLSHMITVGEDTGDVTAMLLRTAEYYDLEVKTATESLMTMMQPMIILLLAGIVGVILAAVLAPMVKMYTELGGAL